MKTIIESPRMVPLGAECLTDSNCTEPTGLCNIEGKCAADIPAGIQFETPKSHFQFSMDAYNVKCYT